MEPGRTWLSASLLVSKCDFLECLFHMKNQGHDLTYLTGLWCPVGGQAHGATSHRGPSWYKSAFHMLEDQIFSYVTLFLKFIFPLSLELG